MCGSLLKISDKVNETQLYINRINVFVIGLYGPSLANKRLIFVAQFSRITLNEHDGTE